jgi:hypothetical protein
MQITQDNPVQRQKVAQAVHFCDKADLKTLEQITDEIYHHQPFLISLFLGYKDEVDPYPPQADEILRTLIIIWLYFRENKNVKRKKITADMFEVMEEKNIRFLKYLEGEPTIQAQALTTLNDFKQLKSLELFTAVLFKIKEGKALSKLPDDEAAIILVGLKSLIECFSKISKPSRLRPRG